MPAPQASTAAEQSPDDQQPSLTRLALDTAAVTGGLLGDILGLAALELRLAGLSLAGILAGALAVSFVGMAFWLLLQAALIVGLTRLGIDLLWLLAAFTLLNGALAVLLLLIMLRLGRNLVFRATAQALRDRNPDAATTPPDSS